MRRTTIALLVCLLAIATAPNCLSQAKSIWPGFRGQGSKGVATGAGADPPLTWNAKDGKNILWKSAIKRHGMSSPVVAGKRLFLTAADHSVRQVLCYDTDTGELLWDHGVNSIAEDDLPFVLDETGYAAPTPVTNGKHVVAVFATGELVCVDMNGKRVWLQKLGVPLNAYGHASSLIYHEDLVFVQYDQKDNPRLLAFELETGKPVWQVKRDALSWSSPILANNNDRMEVILTNCKAVDSYDPKTGERLWRVECLYGEVATSAAYADGLVFVANEGAPAVAIDVSKHAEEPKILWQWDESLPDTSSPVANEDYLIVPTAFGLVSCLNIKTGQLHWEHEFDKGFNSSPIVTGDRVYITDLSGSTQIFKMGKKFEHVGEGDIGEPSYATPAFIGERMYIRGLTHLFCVEQQK